MFGRLKWGGIRGRGIKLKSDMALSVVALVMATVIIILAYIIFERSAVITYTNVKILPVIEKTDRISSQTNMIWDSELMHKTPDPFSSEIDPEALRIAAVALNEQVKRDTKSMHRTKYEFMNQTAAPNPEKALVTDAGTYIGTTDRYVTDMQKVVAYLYDLAMIEAKMNEAVRAVKMSGSVTPEAMTQRDAILATELEKVKKLKPPPVLVQFHDDTVAFLTDYVTIGQQSTAAYIASSGLIKLEALGREGELVLRDGRDQLKADVGSLRASQLGTQFKNMSVQKKRVWAEIYLLRAKYRF